MASLVTSAVDKYHYVLDHKSDGEWGHLIWLAGVADVIVSAVRTRQLVQVLITEAPAVTRELAADQRCPHSPSGTERKAFFSDPRVNSWPMMSSPLPTLFICLFYVYFSKVIGPKIMENRKPFQLRNVLIVYNFLQTVFSAWIFYEYLMSGWWGAYSFRCQPVDYSNNPVAMRMANTCWWYYFSKFTEFLDTIFFILRKKYSQVSTLHVIHHGCMPFSVWMGLKFAPGGHSTFFALLNTFVHIVMYFYYMVSAMGPEYQKYIWWKKYLTTLQIVQFIAIFTHQFQLLFTDCNYPKSFMIWIALHGVLFMFLFSDFYKVKYSQDKSRKGGNSGLCMPVLDDKEKPRTHRKTDSNGTLNNTYIKSDLSDSYKACYSNGSTKGFVSQPNGLQDEIKKDA